MDSQTNPSKDKNQDSAFSVPSEGLFDDRQWLHTKKQYHMTDRELQVAKLVCLGLNNEDIATKLKIKSGTVKTHIRNIYRRIHVKNKIQMVLKFVGAAAKCSAQSGAVFAPPIVEIKNLDKQKRISPNIPQDR